MQNTTEHLIVDSNNTITLTLTEAGAPITVSYTGLRIVFGGVTLFRSADGDGISLGNGVLNITPGLLLDAERDAIRALTKPQLYRAYVVVLSSQEPRGVVYGASDSESQLHLYVTDPV